MQGTFGHYSNNILIILPPLSHRGSGFVMQFLFWDGRGTPLLYFAAGHCNCILPEENGCVAAGGMMVMMMTMMVVVMMVQASIPVISSISPSSSSYFCNS